MGMYMYMHVYMYMYMYVYLDTSVPKYRCYLVNGINV